MKQLFSIILFAIAISTINAQMPSFKKGILVDEFIFDTASFPESHASTIAETPEGLIAAWFGGTKEGNEDVCIWTAHLIKTNGQHRRKLPME